MTNETLAIPIKSFVVDEKLLSERRERRGEFRRDFLKKTKKVLPMKLKKIMVSNVTTIEWLIARGRSLENHRQNAAVVRLAKETSTSMISHEIRSSTNRSKKKRIRRRSREFDRYRETKRIKNNIGFLLSWDVYKCISVQQPAAQPDAKNHFTESNPTMVTRLPMWIYLKHAQHGDNVLFELLFERYRANREVNRE